MNRFAKWPWLVFLIVVGLLTFGILHRAGDLVAQPMQQGSQNSDAPMLDYEAEVRKVKDKARKDKSSRFNSLGNPDKTKQISELSAGVEPLPTNSHWWVGLSALPVSHSTVIVFGEVIVAEAHLSDDKTGIYSEFLVRVEEVFKDTTGSLNIGEILSANRVGGGARFASGKVQKYRIAGQGMPRKGGRYVLFLRKTDNGDLMIVTGYELSNGRVTPLDGEDNKDPRSALPFAHYRGADQSRFLQDLQTAIQASQGEAGE
jgi:hypothetical protein